MSNEQFTKALTGLQEVATLAKAHVDSYTRKDGAVVAAHETSQQAAAPKPAAGGNYGHPNVVGHAEKLSGGDAKEAHAFHFAGKEYHSTGKAGKSLHGGHDVRQFRSGDGHSTWLDHKARVHADNTSEVGALRQKYEAHTGSGEKKPEAPAKPAAPATAKKPKKAAAPALPDAPEFKSKGHQMAAKLMHENARRGDHESVKQGINLDPDVVDHSHPEIKKMKEFQDAAHAYAKHVSAKKKD